MAWNRPNNEEAVSDKRGQSPRYLRAAVAGALVVVLGGVAVWWFLGRAPVPPPRAETVKKVQQAPVAVASVATNAAPQTGKVVKPSKRKRMPKQLPVDRTGKVSTPYISSNSLAITYGAVNGRPLFKKSIFRHTSEQMIDAVLNQQPGLRMIDVPLDKSFEEDFMASLKDPIVIEDGDSEDVRRQKQDMVDVKAEIMERVKNGEKISEIVSDARADLNRIADYADQVKDAYHQSIAESKGGPEEWEVLRKSANKMLKAHGVPPIKPAKRGRFAVPANLVTGEDE